MNKKIVLIPIVFVVGIIMINFLSDKSEEENKVVFHVTLADPDLYINGVYSDSFFIEEGKYSFRFVPNGSSPENLTVTLNGNKFDFSEDFILKGTSHQTGISEYFTWEYEGEQLVIISQSQNVSIVINPNGNERGSVSVDLIQN